jgi:hypothetical protein
VRFCTTTKGKQMSQYTFTVPFLDFPYQEALPKYNLEHDQKDDQLTVFGKRKDIEKFAEDFCFYDYFE